MEILLTNANEKPAGFMIPIPQYPFYSATIAEFDAKQVNHFLKWLQNKVIFAIQFNIDWILSEWRQKLGLRYKRASKVSFIKKIFN